MNPALETTLSIPSHTAILYASLESDKFRELHSLLYSASSEKEPKLRYIIRHVPPVNANPSRNYLSGYGVALDLKKTDYLALDDRRTSSGSSTSGALDIRDMERDLLNCHA